MSVREGEGERERPLGLNPPEGTRRQYEKSFNRNRSGEVCLKFKRQHGHDVRCWCSFFFLFLMFFFCCSGGGRVTESHQKKTQKHPTRSVLYHCHNFSSRGNLFFFFQIR